jgi:hypothetical protein
MIVKLTVQSNIWVSNKSRLIMVTVYGNRYRSMVGLYMMFLGKTRGNCQEKMAITITNPPSCTSHQIKSKWK